MYQNVVFPIWDAYAAEREREGLEARQRFALAGCFAASALGRGVTLLVGMADSGHD